MVALCLRGGVEEEPVGNLALDCEEASEHRGLLGEPRRERSQEVPGLSPGCGNVGAGGGGQGQQECERGVPEVQGASGRRRDP